jgi:hypothetical protein
VGTVRHGVAKWMTDMILSGHDGANHRVSVEVRSHPLPPSPPLIRFSSESRFYRSFKNPAPHALIPNVNPVPPEPSTNRHRFTWKSRFGRMRQTHEKVPNVEPVPPPDVKVLWWSISIGQSSEACPIRSHVKPSRQA